MFTAAGLKEVGSEPTSFLLTHSAAAAERSPDFRAAALSVRVQRPAELRGVQAG